MAAPIKFLSGRQQQQKIGVEGSTQNEKVLEVVGQVGIGTTIFDTDASLTVRGDAKVSGSLDVGDLGLQNLNISGVSTFNQDVDVNADVDISGITTVNTGLGTVHIGVGNTVLIVDGDARIAGVITAQRIHSELYGEFTGSYVAADALVGASLSISGISTFSGDVNIGTAATTVDLPGLYLKGNSAEQNFISNPSISIGGTTAGNWYDTFLVDGPNLQYVRHWASNFDVNFSVPDDRIFVVSNTDGSSSVSPAGVVDGHIAFKINPETSTELRYNKVKKLETTNTGVTVTGGLNVSGISTFQDHLILTGVGKSIVVGPSNDQLSLEHDANGLGLIRQNNELFLSSPSVQITNLDASKVSAEFLPTGGVGLRYNNNTKLQTTASGIDVTGHTETDTLNATGISTLSNVLIGSATTDFIVHGDARITGVITANRIHSELYGEFTGTTVAAEALVGTSLSISGISTLGITSVTDLDVQNVNVSGAITATTFTGDLNGNAGTATSLATARNFEITGDIVASAISFDGTNNVSLAATIQPNSVELGTDTTGEYVASVTGTSNEITVSDTSGQGSTPQVGLDTNVSIQESLTVGTGLSVSGISTLGITSTTDLTSQQLNVSGVSTLGVTTATDLTSQNLNVLGVSTFVGIATFTTSDVYITNRLYVGALGSRRWYGRKCILWSYYFY